MLSDNQKLFSTRFQYQKEFNIFKGFIHHVSKDFSTRLIEPTSLIHANIRKAKGFEHDPENIIQHKLLL